ncbi:MAG: IS200/IS605 family transposase [Chloroflexi bacterium]|nr:MAG: IS200/IS605 family transposase [Chloroflexota bacterium]
MSYWQLYYHVVWATKHRVPILTPPIEETVHGMLRRKAVALEATVFALNGPEDHIHMVVAIPPKIAVATFVGQVKAAVSTTSNKESGAMQSLYWQDAYGVFSFDRKRLPNYVAYVEKQKEHHTNGTTIPILERAGGDIVKAVREPFEVYEMDDEAWRRELEAFVAEG